MARTKYADLGESTYVLAINVPVPSKKNGRGLGYRADGKLKAYTPRQLQREIDDITMLLRQAWHQHGFFDPAAPGVSIEMTLETANLQQDGDGMETTILDCLQQAGVIINDNAKHVFSCRWQIRKSDQPCSRVYISKA